MTIYYFRFLRRLVLNTTSHKDLMEKVVARYILANYLPSLLESIPLTPGVRPGFSASTTFAVTVLQHLANRIGASICFSY